MTKKQRFIVAGTLIDIYNKAKDHILLLTLCFYALGLIYHSFYYKSFNLNILYYCDLNDILLYPFYILLKYSPIVVLGYFFITSFAYCVVRLNDKFKKREYSRKRTLVQIKDITIAICLIAYVCIWTFTKYEYAGIITQTVKWCLIFIGFINYYVANPKHYRLYFIFFISLSMVQSYLFADINSEDKKESANLKNISFNYDEQLISWVTKPDLIYIGETSSYVFMYDKNCKQTKVFDKSSISNLTFYTSETKELGDYL